MRDTRLLSLTLIVLAAAAAGACSREAAPPADPPARATAGMVSSAHPLATQAGLDVLADGGNAFDATVAVAAALNVVEPMMSGMGGYGTILVYSAAEDTTLFLNPSGRIPQGVRPDEFRAPTPGYMENRRGAKAVSTPGNVNAWAAMHGRFGAADWPRLFAPAIRLARDGFVLDDRIAGFIERAYDDFPDHARAVYGPGDAPLGPGDRLIQTDLGRSLELVARDGPDAFYRGELAQAVDRAMRDADGFLRLRDLRENEAEWWAPIAIDYREHRVATASPPANSFPALVRLGLMSRFDVPAMGHNSVAYLHTYAEVTKHAFWTRLAYAGDPEVDPPPLDTLLAAWYWDDVARSLPRDTATEFVPPSSRVPEATRHTTHFVVADRFGNVVSATQTLGNAFGARIMPAGTGIWLNNSLAYSTFEPAGNPMDAHPGRRKLSGDVPLFVLDQEGRPWLAIGTPGGHTIAQTVPQMVINVLDFGMDIQRAIAQPRIAFIEPNQLAVEDRIPDRIRDALVRMGHDLRTVPGIGNAHGLTIEWGPDGLPAAFTGGADPRGAGLAKGLEQPAS